MNVHISSNNSENDLKTGGSLSPVDCGQEATWGREGRAEMCGELKGTARRPWEGGTHGLGRGQKQTCTGGPHMGKISPYIFGFENLMGQICEFLQSVGSDSWEGEREWSPRP